MCHPYARSATERNLSDKINSIKPRTTFTVLSHEPDRGSSLSIEGKKAKKPKGKASPRAKPAHAQQRAHKVALRECFYKQCADNRAGARERYEHEREGHEEDAQKTGSILSLGIDGV